jgi:hypothetical protein
MIDTPLARDLSFWPHSQVASFCLLLCFVTLTCGAHGFHAGDLGDRDVLDRVVETGESPSAVVEREGLAELAIPSFSSRTMVYKGLSPADALADFYLDLAEERGLPVEWFALSSGAKISMDSGTENMDWISRVLRGIIEFTQDGGEILPTGEPTSALQIRAINYVLVQVNDLRKAEQFYQDFFAMELLGRVRRGPDGTLLPLPADYSWDRALQTGELADTSFLSNGPLTLAAQRVGLGVLLGQGALETVSLGAAYAAGLATGFWGEIEDLRENWVEDKRWEPTMDAAQRDEYYKFWKKAVTRTFDWFEADEE